LAKYCFEKQVVQHTTE